MEMPARRPDDGLRDLKLPVDGGGAERRAPPPEEKPSLIDRIRTALIGKPRSLRDRSVFQHVSLAAFLAWVGLGADGLSSSSYGPPEAYANLVPHTYLAAFIAAAMAFTVVVISACYGHIIEEFPTGGGGYSVASKLLGNRTGVVSGCALLVDYVLTITVSISAAGDAIFGLIGPDSFPGKVPAELIAVAVLIVLNLRGIRESILVLLPIFLLFLVTHIVLIAGVLIANVPAAAAVSASVARGIRDDLARPAFGLGGMVFLFLHAYSLGGGTYTGIEAVSNSMPVMREPRVATGKRTMVYMAVSLALTSGGLMLGYLLLGLRPSPRETLNTSLARAFVGEMGLGRTWGGELFVLLTITAEGALLVVAAQTGFIDGPRVLANMAKDSWVPRWFANFSTRLATHNGILVMGLSALALLYFTRGDVGFLVVLYSINVFLTFSLSMVGMARHWWLVRCSHPRWRRRLALFLLGAALCITILLITSVEKFTEGGWLTFAITGCAIGTCFLIHRYYGKVSRQLRRLDEVLDAVPKLEAPVMADPDPALPTAGILVGGYTGLGVHTLMNAIRFVPGYFKNVVFLSVGVVDSGNFKGTGAVEALARHTQASLDRFVQITRQIGLPAASFLAIGTDPVLELERLCKEAFAKFSRTIFFAGQLVFQKETWYQRLLHNETAYHLQRRLKWAGLPIVILPTRVD